MGATFSESAARRIANVVRRVEREGAVVTPYRARYYPGFTGTVYLNGDKYTGLNSDPSKPWVKVLIDGSAAPSQELGPPSDPFPPGEEWYEKSGTYGDIHVIGTR